MDIGSDNAFAKMPSALVEEFSPSLPKGFPVNKIPENKCEKELLLLFKCTSIFGVAMKCGEEYDGFQKCKKQRDLQLFNEIKAWEIDHFGTLSQDQKQTYIQDMENKIEKLKADFEKIPFSTLYQNKLWRFTSDIEQLTWRSNTLRKLLPS